MIGTRPRPVEEKFDHEPLGPLFERVARAEGGDVGSSTSPEVNPSCRMAPMGEAGSFAARLGTIAG
jgi:hypothetical protein